jgi:hypothetical protein
MFRREHYLPTRREMNALATKVELSTGGERVTAALDLVSAIERLRAHRNGPMRAGDNQTRRWCLSIIGASGAAIAIEFALLPSLTLTASAKVPAP